MDERKPDELPVVLSACEWIARSEGDMGWIDFYWADDKVPSDWDVAPPDVVHHFADHATATALIASLQAKLEAAEREIEQFKQTVRTMAQEAARDELVRSAGDAAARALRRAEAAEQQVQELREDKALLDSGRIMLHERDEFGEPFIREIVGINLRAAIGAATKGEAA
jgi:hypothetical protein